MKWSDVIDLISEEVGSDVACKIEEVVRRRFPGERITINKHPIVTAEIIHKTAPGKPRIAAKKLGIHQSTAYRVLNRRGIIR
jgi:transcriptional regulator of acetoin/glycerol metabolism